MLTAVIDSLGAAFLRVATGLGTFILYLVQIVGVLFSFRLKVKKLFEQLYHIGFESLPIVILTGSFAGMVFALQSYVGFQRVGGEQFIGALVALGMIRELGPVLTGLMIAGRAGSSMAAQLGTMRISEQIDALITLHINPIQYLVVPRILASTLMLPCLTLIATACGIVGGYFVCVYVLYLNGHDYITNITLYVELIDILSGLAKATVFGFIIGCVGTYKGFYTTDGARGVGRSTTQSVVASSISILIANYFLTKLF